jgi:hypothetical protein
VSRHVHVCVALLVGIALGYFASGFSSPSKGPAHLEAMRQIHVTYPDHQPGVPPERRILHTLRVHRVAVDGVAVWDDDANVPPASRLWEIGFGVSATSRIDFTASIIE